MYKVAIKTLTVALLMVSIAVSAQAQFSDAFISDIEKRMSLDQMPGISMAFVDEQGEVSYRSLGYTSLNKTRTPDEHTLYEIGSITKTFTASLLMILLEERGLDADVTFNELLGSDHRLQLPEPHGDAITLSHMMSHKSSIPRLPDNMVPADGNDPYKDYTIEAMIEYSNSLTYNHAPGEEFEYSNHAYKLLGYLVSELSGKPFDELLAERITGPLGMNSTYREVPESDQSRLAAGSAFGEPASSWNFDEMRGLGELKSSAHDMAIYIKAQYGYLEFDGDEAVRKAHEPIHEMREGRHMSNGWFVHELEAGDVIVSHGGGTGGYRAFAAFSTKTGRGAVALTNSNTEVGDIAMHLVNDTYEMRSLPDYSAIDDDLANRLTGMYLNPNIGMMTITYTEGVLRGQIQGQPALPLEFVENLTFRNTMVGAEVEFVMDEDDERSSGFTLRQGGIGLEFKHTTEAPDGPQKVEMSREQLMEYAGHFDSEIGMSYEIRAADGHISARLSGQPFASVYPEGEDRFFYEVVPATIMFQRDDTGNITGVTLFQGGQEIRFTKRSNLD